HHLLPGRCVRTGCGARRQEGGGRDGAGRAQELSPVQAGACLHCGSVPPGSPRPWARTCSSWQGVLVAKGGDRTEEETVVSDDKLFELVGRGLAQGPGG